MPNVVSLFSGAGGFDLGFEQAGFTTAYQCEINEHATNILNRHWPDVPRWGDVQTLTGADVFRLCPAADVVIWGSPCQDLSASGNRSGLAGEKSKLFHEGIRVINELREATNGRYPRISVWENVAGALNSNGGADFGTVLDQMAQAGALVIEWALLDAQHFGVPQRRRRVFVVAIFDPDLAERCPSPLLPVSEGLRRDSKAGRSQGKEDPTALAGRTGGHGGNEGEIAQTASGGTNEEAPFSFDTNFGSNAEIFVDLSPPLKSTQRPPSIAHGSDEMVIRRLTPLECERLMGWPDGWTDGQADSHRYQQCGNGVAVPVAKWIGSHILRLFPNTKEEAHV